MGGNNMKTINKRTIFQILNKYAIYLILVVMIIVMSIVKPDSFPTLNNFLNVLRQMTTIGIMAIGVTFVIITAGPDLSGGSVVALCSVVVAQLSVLNDGSSKFPLTVAILLTILVGAFAGLVNGLMTSYGNVPPFIGTLGMMWVARGIANLLSNSRPISGFDTDFIFIGSGSILGKVPTPIVIFVACGIIAYVLLHKTKFGMYIYAIGGNENAALVSGIKVKRIKTLAYVLGGAFTAIAAIVITSRQQSGQPGMGEGYEMEAITCAIIGGSSLSGGVGGIPGTVIGELIMGVIANSMTMLQVDPNWQMVIKGAIIALAVLLDVHKKTSN